MPIVICSICIERIVLLNHLYIILILTSRNHHHHHYYVIMIIIIIVVVMKMRRESEHRLDIYVAGCDYPVR